MKKNLFSNKLPELSSQSDLDSPKQVYSATDITLWIASVGLSLVFLFLVTRLVVLWQSEQQPKTISRPSVSRPSSELDPLSFPKGSDIQGDDLIDKDVDFQADQLVFNALYQAPETKWSSEILNNSAQVVDLPVNIKKEAVNYHEVRRQYNLEPIVSQLNNNGVAVVENPFGSASQDFFDFYQLAKDDHWPLLLTNDVIYYYYQNNIKEAYRAVEAGFYDSLWNISSGLLVRANQRYQASLSQGWPQNSPLLEAYRLNIQYWAVVVNLLAAQPSQVGIGGLTSGSVDFQTGDDQKYKAPQLSNSLSREINKEIELINQAKEISVSPVFGHQIDYQNFLPSNDYYQGGGRLVNFFKASRWLNYTWPTYSQADHCPDCSLDIDDWRINFLAANILARDLAGDQLFKNYWARVYKVINYFSGLRDELTYLHYVQAQQDVLGDQTLEDIVLLLDEEEYNQTLEQLQLAILENSFLTKDGGYSRQQSSQWSKIGLRILQDRYWPGEQIDWLSQDFDLISFINQQNINDWQTNQFWSSLEMIKEWFNNPLIYHHANQSKEQQLALARFYLLNWQRPPDQRGIVLVEDKFVQSDQPKNSLITIETNGLAMIDRQIAEAQMLRLAFSKLQVNNLLSEKKLNETINLLQRIKNLVIKQANGETWTKSEQDSLNSFFQLKLLSSDNGQVSNLSINKLDWPEIVAKIELKNIDQQLQIVIGPIIKP